MTSPAVPDLTRLATSDELDQVLSDLNDIGTNPVVVGFDAHGNPFLAYGWAPGGDGWDAGFVDEDPHSSEFDYTDGTERCQECGAFDRRHIEKLAYPVTLAAPSLLAAYRERDEMRADRNEWRNAAYAAKGHYEQSDDRLARVEAVCRDAESMQWADVSRAYGEGVSAAISWVRAALGSTEPKDGTE